ncbi:histidine phosphatase superfamily domain-containing protein [Rhizoctonia solani AG-1 IA]|uniref:Histidine phosphatase superfamily domain-containing protein n=1 Tax=Thanatephorus cucumeris (strain AG1-IA) TaxID=983506 RepID=L8X220_THACA|nr:histidine phosphatase superfamily domain-containing protein [Rhizoctonia solani AG-1 IA]
MAEVKRPMPRIFLIRHTGRTDIPLTERGVGLIKDRAQHAVELLDPDNMCHVFISPRQRAHNTFHLLFDTYPKAPPHTVTEEVREWDYGDYEGLTSKEIHKTNPGWDIFRDGAYPVCYALVEEMTRRVDELIAKVREIHRLYLEEGKGRRDVLICSHGHFSRVLVSRWVGFDLCLGTHFNIEPAGISMLGYNHNNLKEPSLTGLNLPQPRPTRVEPREELIYTGHNVFDVRPGFTNTRLWEISIACSAGPVSKPGHYPIFIAYFQRSGSSMAAMVIDRNGPCRIPFPVPDLTEDGLVRYMRICYGRSVCTDVNQGCELGSSLGAKLFGMAVPHSQHRSL